MNHSVSKHTLFTYLAGQATPIERQTVEEWLKNPANTPTFHAWLLEWEMRSLQFVPDQEAAFEKMVQRLDQTERPEADEEPMPIRKPLFFWGGWKPYLVAATVLLALLIPLRNKLFYQTHYTTYGETKTLRLEDGTGVVLKSNSSLQVPRFGFYTNIREVFLTGEGRFSVTHKPDHQRFVVKTSDQFQIEVLGTEFTVYARKQSTNVALGRGKIRVDYSRGADKHQLTMKPGDLLTLSHQGNLHLRQLPAVPPAETRGKTGLTFKETSVWEVCYLLRENFGLKVEIVDDSLAQRTISGNYHADNADELLDVLTETLEIKTEKTGTGLLLKNN